ncbi:hypothetical protein WK13_34820 [Burkholderia ubonensis]|uniref:hypothetical protein n=1 Tax=Burkholderia ubonensis TaxID=101571 RepID=UPI00075DBA23|nr:hypothetical protein [Burkholderia ubonensis]KVR21714.1 hypothetical protein WK13_34820 [Burkholderia ubonensis]
MAGPANTTNTKQKQPNKSRALPVPKVIGEDTYMVMADSAYAPEDEFGGMYFTQSNPGSVILRPPFQPKVLLGLATRNNILNQCIEAMEVNVDSTGYEFVPKVEGGKVDKAQKQIAESFFNEPFPGKTFQQIRRTLRREQEGVGYSYLEVLRNLDDEVVAIRNLSAVHTRLVKYDEPVEVSRTVERNGAEVDIKMMDRERRYMTKFGKNETYYREFGASRQLNKRTGEWETDGNPVDPKDRATEVIMFGVNPDVESSYYTPRWINQLPSVIGSRKAEEQNLEFFDSGGLPPAIIFVQGGSLAGATADQLRNYLSGKNKAKQRAVVVEAQSTSGSIDAAGSVQIKVERFGSQASGDNMFENYDKRAEDHVRTGFRLPPLFTGRAADYNYATAVVAYMVAEEQVFQPERADFDSIINATIMKALGCKDIKLQSKGITLKNVDSQVKALQLAKDLSKGDSFVKEVNQIAGTNLEYDKNAAPDRVTITEAVAPGQDPQVQNQAANGGQQVKMQQKTKTPAGGATPGAGGSASTGAPKPSTAKKGGAELFQLALDYAALRGTIAVKHELSPAEKAEVLAEFDALEGDDREATMRMVAALSFGSANDDLVHLVACNHTH